MHEFWIKLEPTQTWTMAKNVCEENRLRKDANTWSLTSETCFVTYCVFYGLDPFIVYIITSLLWFSSPLNFPKITLAKKCRRKFEAWRQNRSYDSNLQKRCFTPITIKSSYNSIYTGSLKSGRFCRSLAVSSLLFITKSTIFKMWMCKFAVNELKYFLPRSQGWLKSLGTG